MRVSLLAAAAVMLAAGSGRALGQWRVGSDSATRWTRFGRDVAYGTAEGLAFAGVDQIRKEPPQWGTGWNGYGKRAASNVGEFLIQEGVTEGLAAAMHRPIGYKHCTCHDVASRIGWAVKTAFTDPLPNGRTPLAVPRIVGAYAGSFAQASWRPDVGNRTQVALVNGTTSLAIGALINLWYELR